MAKNLNNQVPSNFIGDGKNMKEKSGWSTNAKWIVSLLVMIVISLIAMILNGYVVNGDKLLSALENFSTILSIVLSVSSIAFAAYTSIETGRQFHFMSRAVEEIRTSNDIMSDNYKNLLKHYHDTVNSFVNKDSVSSSENKSTPIQMEEIKNVKNT
mgnify:CR=1 FL=1